MDEINRQYLTDSSIHLRKDSADKRRVQVWWQWEDTAHDHIFCVTLLHCELDGELLGELDGELCLAHLILALPCQLIKMLQQ